MTDDVYDYIGKFVVTDSKLEPGDLKHDKDRCKYTWDTYFNKIYKEEEYWKKNCFKRIKVKNGYGITDCKINMTGDTLFNFKSINDTEEKKRNQKYELFEDKLKEKFSADEFEYYIGILRFCNRMNYSFYNFGFMPTNGDFQATKNNEDDRLDRFLFILNDYYSCPAQEKENHPIFKHVTHNPRGRKIPGESKEDRSKRGELFRKEIISTMIEYLDSFESVYNFCKVMFLIDDSELIKRMLDSGANEINDGKDVVEYMKIAILFWVYKDKKYHENKLRALLIENKIVKENFLD